MNSKPTPILNSSALPFDGKNTPAIHGAPAYWGARAVLSGLGVVLHHDRQGYIGPDAARQALFDALRVLPRGWLDDVLAEVRRANASNRRGIVSVTRGDVGVVRWSAAERGGYLYVAACLATLAEAALAAPAPRPCRSARWHAIEWTYGRGAVNDAGSRLGCIVWFLSRTARDAWVAERADVPPTDAGARDTLVSHELTPVERERAVRMDATQLEGKVTP